MNSFNYSSLPFNSLLLLCTLLFVSVTPETSTEIYELNIGQTQPVKIIEAGPLWKTQTLTQKPEEFLKRALSHRSYSAGSKKSNLEDADASSDVSESNDFQAQPLKDFLNSYAQKVKKRPSEIQGNSEDDSSDEEPEVVSGGEKSKSWDLLNVQKHHHPFEDKKGWVSLEPIPWSVSKISKWQSHYKPKPSLNHYGEDKPWQDTFEDNYEDRRPYYPQSHRPYDRIDSDNSYKFSNKIGIRDNYDVYYINRPNLTPSVAKPSATFTHKLQIQSPGYGGDIDRVYNNQKPTRHSYNKHDESCNKRSDIIVDSSAPDFPSSYPESNRRYGTELQPESQREDHPKTHPFNGQGDWVLLSTTKGYRHSPSRERSLKLDPDSIGAHRGVRLTVLPPLKNSNVNMTTSHGGLLQVESTFQTVEQAHKEYTKNQNKKQKAKKKQKNKKPTKTSTTRRPFTLNRPITAAHRPGNQVNRPTITAVTANRRNTGPPDSGAVLAAVGAGMIPATMAMLVPIALNGRRKRDLQGMKLVTFKPVSSASMTLTQSM